MPTPKAGYFLRDGSRVPGTTTIIGRFKQADGLLQWAFQQGKAGKSRLYETAEEAADIGTCAHGMLELSISGASESDIAAYAVTTLPEEGMRDQAWSAFDAYRAWACNFRVSIIRQELQLVSEQHRYGGTLDAVGLAGNELSLFDWKTSNSIYSDYLIQLAAYANLWTENFPEQVLTGGFHLLRFAKDHADFSHHHFAKLDEAWRQFLLFREAYEIDKRLKKRAA